ncbi:MAG: hypothetical protein M1831_004197 [Alyxoria varia]|nr:MAG: hypothetical protein M1831_004197 [Alyxoria varia]
MVVPFGFSAGDFVGGINLIRDIIKALESSAGASANYQELIRELYTLEYALKLVKDLKLDDAPSAKAALTNALESCRSTITRFLSRNKNFAPHLALGESRSSLRHVMRKIQWTFKEDDVRNFRSELNAHTGSINTLLGVYQIEAIRGYAQRLQEQQDALLSRTSHLDDIAFGLARSRVCDNEIRNLRADLRGVSRNLRSSKTTSGIYRVKDCEIGQTAADFDGVVESLQLIEHDELLHTNQNMAANPLKRIASSEATGHDSGTSDLTVSEEGTGATKESHPGVVPHPPTLREQRCERNSPFSSSTFKDYLLQKKWKILGAWLGLTAYIQTAHQNDNYALPYCQNEETTIIEVDMHTRFLAADFEFLWGCVNGRTCVKASLALPSVLHDEENDPMIRATIGGDVSTMQRLFSEGRYQPIDMDTAGWSLLQLATLRGEPEVVSFLLQHGAKPNAGTSEPLVSTYRERTLADMGPLEESLGLFVAVMLCDPESRTFDPLRYRKRELDEEDFSYLYCCCMVLEKEGFVEDTFELMKEALEADPSRPKPMLKLSSAHDFKRNITAHYLDPNCPSKLQKRKPRRYQDE